MQDKSDKNQPVYLLIALTDNPINKLTDEMVSDAQCEIPDQFLVNSVLDGLDTR